ncbi:MAG TPA: response regulator transcription factor [Polyangiaceae bacterium]|nr:response regulator transcription factor [Polyangiaceae bacterium]HMR80594.1 response regulator transcription factor [Polyangiaceae bacterium]
MPRALLIEDDADLSEVIAYNLQQEGYQVDSARTGQDGLRLVRANTPSIVLLDVVLPDIRGTDICREIRSDTRLSGVPIVFLTARDEEIDRVVGFELGADDYVTKPFSMRELMLRVRALLRRAETAPTAASTFRAGRLKVDREAHRAWVGAQEVQLTALEFRLLVALWERGGRVQSREALLDSVWGGESTASSRTVDAHIKRLRDKLGTLRDCVETVRGSGYRFADTASAARE